MTPQIQAKIDNFSKDLTKSEEKLQAANRELEALAARCQQLRGAIYALKELLSEEAPRSSDKVEVTPK